MSTYYALLALPFLAFVLVLDMLILKTFVVKKPGFLKILAIMMLLTAVFDQLLTGLPIVEYSPEKISGLKLFFAPIEDFAYTIAVVILTGSMLNYGKK